MAPEGGSLQSELAPILGLMEEMTTLERKTSHLFTNTPEARRKLLETYSHAIELLKEQDRNMLGGADAIYEEIEKRVARLHRSAAALGHAHPFHVSSVAAARIEDNAAWTSLYRINNSVEVVQKFYTKLREKRKNLLLNNCTRPPTRLEELQRFDYTLSVARSSDPDSIWAWSLELAEISTRAHKQHVDCKDQDRLHIPLRRGHCGLLTETGIGRST